MDELYLIMERFLKNEFDINSVICVLNTIENAHIDDEQNELRCVINMLLINLGSVAEELHTNINTLDEFIVNNK